MDAQDLDARQQKALVAAEKPALLILDTPELNAETPAHLLDDEITPLAHLFVRNAGTMPQIDPGAADSWSLTIDGCVQSSRSWSIAALRQDFETVTEASVLECAGNGRAFFTAPVGPTLWRHGAAGCIAWTGVRLADLVRACEPLATAVYTGHYSPDRRLDDRGPALSRGVPIAKARSPETLIAWAANGEPIPVLHGGPLRLIAPGYPASASQKWITRVEIRDREHDGERMGGLNYRLPRRTLARDEPIDPSEFEVITDMPVRAVITSPADGFTAAPGGALHVRGFAWSGHTAVARVEVSCDGARSWTEARLAPARTRFAWRRFEAVSTRPATGPIEIVARATDAAGRAQPLASAPWNPRGYCNNTVHRVSGRVG